MHSLAVVETLREGVLISVTMFVKIQRNASTPRTTSANGMSALTIGIGFDITFCKTKIASACARARTCMLGPQMFGSDRLSTIRIPRTRSHKTLQGPGGPNSPVVSTPYFVSIIIAVSIQCTDSRSTLRHFLPTSVHSSSLNRKDELPSRLRDRDER